jgi:short-subunit dehydrogenase
LSSTNDISGTFFNRYGPWALVAGASEGIGAAFAEALARRGLNLILLARRAEKLYALAQELESKYDVQTEGYGIDLGEYESMRSVINAMEQDIGLLVYNAAYSPIGYFVDVPEKDLQKAIDVNVRAPLTLIKLLSAKMTQRKKGGIILMSSLSGMQGSPKIATYSATKSFNTILAEGLWHELKRENIDVLACTAGAVRTRGYLNSSDHKDAPGTLDPEKVVEETLHSLGGKPAVTPGLTNKIARFVMGRLLPRKTAISIMHNNTKDLNSNQS